MVEKSMTMAARPRLRLLLVIQIVSKRTSAPGPPAPPSMTAAVMPPMATGGLRASRNEREFGGPGERTAIAVMIATGTRVRATMERMA
jgi:hypothetical protein